MTESVEDRAALDAALVHARLNFGKVVLDKQWPDGMKYASLESIECAIRQPLLREGIVYRFGEFGAANRMPENGILWFSREIVVSGHGAKIVTVRPHPVEWDPKSGRVADKALEDLEVHSKRMLLGDMFALVIQEEDPEWTARMDRLMSDLKRVQEAADKADLVGSA